MKLLLAIFALQIVLVTLNLTNIGLRLAKMLRHESKKESIEGGQGQASGSVVPGALSQVTTPAPKWNPKHTSKSTPKYISKSSSTVPTSKYGRLLLKRFYELKKILFYLKFY
jgi:hypothetical protein